MGEKNRPRAASANSDDEELRPLAAYGQKALAAMKRTMTKSASERAITTPERSHTPPPTFQPFSPQPSSSISANTSPTVSPAVRRREEVPAMELSQGNGEEEIAGEAVHAEPQSESGEHTPRDGTDEHALSDASDHSAELPGEHETPLSSTPDNGISPLHAPLIEDYEQDSANNHTHVHEHEHETTQEAAEHPLTPPPTAHAPEISLNLSSSGGVTQPTSPTPTITVQPTNVSQSTSPTPTVSAASTSAPASPVPNGTPTPSRAKNIPELHDKIKLPPIVEQCEHMGFGQFTDWIQVGDETFPCPIQDFYRLILASNFWSEVNDACGYTEATLTPWLSRNSNTGSCCLYRQLNWRMELNGKIGPKSTRVQQTQRCRLKNSKELIVETSSVSADVPYGDSFTTDNLLILKSTNNGASCQLRATCRVNFVKSTWGLGGIIEKSANQGSKDFFAQWVVAVRQKIEKEYTKPRALATPPPTHKVPAHPTASQVKSPSRHPLTSHSSPSLTTHQPPPSVSQVAQKPATPAPQINPLPQSAFSPISPSPKKFWPNLKHQMLQLPMPVAGLFVVVLLILSIGVPYTLYLHSRVAYAESHLIEFNNAVGRIENKISFMQLYINYLKEHPTSTVPPSASSKEDDLKAELAGLAHLLDVSAALEKRMDQWNAQLAGAGKSLASTQDLVTSLRSEMSQVLLRKEGQIEGEGEERKGGWLYFIVGTCASLAVIAVSMYYFRESLPFKLK